MKKNEQLSFEKAMEGLERAAEALKKEGTTLEDALSQFEEGMGYYSRCVDLLSEAKQRIMLYDKRDDLLKEFE